MKDQEIYRYAYVTYNKCNGNEKKLREYSTRLGISFEEFKNMAMDYEKFLKNPVDRKVVINEAKLAIATNYINRYISGMYYSVEEFCDESFIDKGTFLSMLEMVEENNHMLYQSYQRVNNRRSKEKHDLSVLVVNKIIDGIKEGVGEEKRKFSLEDYNNLTTKSFEDTLLLANTYAPSEDILALRKFFTNVEKEKNTSK